MSRTSAVNLLENLPSQSREEVFETLLQTDAFRLERIFSLGHATPAGEWYDQETDEWVLLLCGAARLLFEGDAEPLALRPGDSVFIPAHARHRVASTAPGEPTVWLALHFPPPARRQNL